MLIRKIFVDLVLMNFVLIDGLCLVKFKVYATLDRGKYEATNQYKNLVSWMHCCDD